MPSNGNTPSPGPITEIVKVHFDAIAKRNPLTETLDFWAEQDPPLPWTAIEVPLTTEALAQLADFSIHHIRTLQKVCYELAGAIDALVKDRTDGH